jgi:putative NIF3 family GTP cyclohydrolase 1 type 2
VGEPTSDDEVRIEAVCPPGTAAAVLSAVREVHPYEEPLITFSEALLSRGDVAIGRYADLDEPSTLSEVVGRVAEEFGCTPRVWGEPSTSVSRLATSTGSASSMIPAVAGVEADALLAGEVRYHDALDALRRGVAVIEAGHDVTEWPLVPILADAVRETPALTDEQVIVEEPSRSWWTP